MANAENYIEVELPKWRADWLYKRLSLRYNADIGNNVELIHKKKDPQDDSSYVPYLRVDPQLYETLTGIVECMHVITHANTIALSQTDGPQGIAIMPRDKVSAAEARDLHEEHTAPPRDWYKHKEDAENSLEKYIKRFDDDDPELREIQRENIIEFAMVALGHVRRWADAPSILESTWSYDLSGG